ncbi:MAG: hypothetical protein Q8P39_00700 [Candidatus Yanofskybacteria bacterium]|nr:hypothetical protein [Candidatus Yanofskybacteria bacterium]
MPSNNRKIIDIAPPHVGRRGDIQRTLRIDALNEDEQNGRRVPRSLFMLFGLLLLSGFGMVHFFFAKAEVQVWPQIRELSLEESVSVIADSQAVQPLIRSIPGHAVAESRQATKLYPAFGLSSASSRATGTIRVYNTQRTAQTLVAQTRFLSENNKLFRIETRVVVPAAASSGTPGTLDVRVVAAEAGESYNIGSSNFALPGLAGSALYTQVYARSFEPMKGGSTEQITVVTDQDIQQARNAILADLKREAHKSMEAELPAGFTLDADLLSLHVLEAGTPIRPGAELGEFNYSAKVEVRGVAFRLEDLQELASELLRTRLLHHEELEREVMISYGNGRLQEEGKVLIMEMEAHGTAYETVDPVEIKKQIQGLQESAAERILADYLSVAQAKVSLWPFWVKSVPGSENRIRVDLHIDESRPF